MNDINNSNVNLAPSPSRLFTSPPRPPLAFRVGVVGHRPNRLANADINQLNQVLKTILSGIKNKIQSFSKTYASLYDNSPPILRAISPLAEGTDRLFAEQALDLGFELCCIMPFPQAEFEKDFAPGNALETDSLDRFRSLLVRAEEEIKLTRFELDGSRKNPEKAYGDGGRVVLNQSDILVIVWDGEAQGKIGGTEETFQEARNKGVPLVWVDACAPHTWQILESGDSLPEVTKEARVHPNGSGTSESLKKLIKGYLDLPAPSVPSNINDNNIKKNLMAFYAEDQPKASIAVLWKAFRDILGDSKPPDVTRKITPFEEAVIKEWPNDRSTPLKKIVDWLRPFYAWPDKLSVIYADRYRSAFILVFMLAAVAVGLALIPMGLSFAKHSIQETIVIASEFSIIVTILYMVFRGRKHRWHERWIEYRLVSELVRHLRLVAPMGGERPFPQIPAHWATYGQPASSWMAWYVRAVERALGLPTVVVDKKHLVECLTDLLEILEDQIDYHKTNAARCHKIEHRLHTSGILFLILTLIACGLHLIPAVIPGVHFPVWLPNLLTFCCGFFPAMGAALAGIINQGEFLRIAKRSEAMKIQLESLKSQTNCLKEQIFSSVDLSDYQFSSKAVQLAGDVAHLMVYEVLDWRVVFLDRPLIPPA